MTHTAVVLWAGFAIGLVFGAIGQRIEFCLSGGLREWWTEGKPRRAAVFLFATGVAVAGTHLVSWLGFVDLRETIYYQAGFSWILVPLGGILFGYGMILAAGCGSRALVLLGDGNLRSLVVLLCLGVSAGVTLTGLLAEWRLSLNDATMVIPDLPSPSLPGAFQSWGLNAGISTALPAFVVAALLVGAALYRMGLRNAPGEIVGAFILGCLPPAGWIVTAYFGADDFDPVQVESLTFVAPIGDSIQYLMLSTGIELRFGVVVVAGVILGSFVVSTSTRSFELRGFDSPRHMLRSVGGGILMGIGGALALGCSIGQGITGFSTLALASILAAAGIYFGGFLALRGDIRGSEQLAGRTSPKE